MKLLSLFLLLLFLGCARHSGGYVPFTFQLWAQHSRPEEIQRIDITELTEDDRKKAQSLNPGSRIWHLTNGKVILMIQGRPNFEGFFMKVVQTPIALTIDGAVVFVVFFLRS